VFCFWWGGVVGEVFMKMVIFNALLSHAYHNIELNKNMRAIISPKSVKRKCQKYSVWFVKQGT
jgi:hypothetical protein